MKVRRVKIFPYLLFYTDSVPNGSAGCANAFVVRIRPEYKEDKGLEAHEAIHIAQFWRTLGFHSLFYLFIKRYRLAAEVEAFRVQLTFCNEWDKEINRQTFAERIATKYGIKISAEEAYKLL